MDHKVITLIKQELYESTKPIEHTPDELKPHLDQGYEIRSITCTPVIRQNMVFGATTEQGTLVHLAYTYWLERANQP